MQQAILGATHLHLPPTKSVQIVITTTDRPLIDRARLSTATLDLSLVLPLDQNL
jgi:hypothetical protein